MTQYVAVGRNIYFVQQ